MFSHEGEEGNDSERADITVTLFEHILHAYMLVPVSEI